ncbi:hypothetical protein CYME_CMO298C [Cyanidioschyzon merolae strain 10D]|uniref:SS18 N-terminal domain-containing protein n=1 Tax=Cyanidioschyzon merolae (strain NIES-3377 / 10D) TaxID=280699 RepID=M1V615_CYAM1|nr:hypothetical protein CYME_CMO298C [Cyanidioschyzon merolae strain 10D]BAM81630.1 hypothetical protein CYME_CMO298C [Cyanidioschyzon merolae strain 10D]|eukprot:XP_005537666.1 hypothetical protein CYME_CMO298C [Cyanidioschyzon merolae strain 10D]
MDNGSAPGAAAHGSGGQQTPTLTATSFCATSSSPSVHEDVVTEHITLEMDTSTGTRSRSQCSAAGGATPRDGEGVTTQQQAAAHLLSTLQNPTTRPPFPLLTTDAIQLILDENYDLIRAICAAQELGRIEHCAALGSRLHANLVYLATVADHQPANTPGLAGIAAANTIAATEKAAAAQELQARAQIPRHVGSNAAASIAAKMAIGAAAMARKDALEAPSETPTAGSIRRKRIRSETMNRHWTPEEHAKFLELVHDPSCRTEDGRYNVSLMSERIGTRDNKQVRSHLQKYLLKRQHQLRRASQDAQPSSMTPAPSDSVG